MPRRTLRISENWNLAREGDVDINLRQKLMSNDSELMTAISGLVDPWRDRPNLELVTVLEGGLVQITRERLVQILAPHYETQGARYASLALARAEALSATPRDDTVVTVKLGKGAGEISLTLGEFINLVDTVRTRGIKFESDPDTKEWSIVDRRGMTLVRAPLALAAFWLLNQLFEPEKLKSA